MHLNGDDGIMCKEDALSGTRLEFFKAMEKGSPITPLSTLMLSSMTASYSLGSSENASNLTAASQKQGSVLRSSFWNDVDL
ncbi:hypothetical protein OROMI_014742 [Orobanche minor]